MLQNIDWLAVAPPLTVALTALVVLLADLFLPAARKNILGWITVAGLALALGWLLPLRDGTRTSFCVGGSAERCSYQADAFALVMQLLVLGGALVVALLSQPEAGDEEEPPAPDPSHTPDASDTPSRRLPAGEFWFLLLASVTGAALLPASRDLATLVIALEVASLPAFALVALRRDAKGGEAALKFFLTSVTATAVTLLGIAFLYAATGTLFVAELADGLGEVPAQLRTLAGLGAVLTLAGFLFKTAAAPFHMWVPDTYTGAPLPVAAYLSVVGKAAGLSGLVVIGTLALEERRALWGTVLAVLAALTMTIGNLAALRAFAGPRARTAGPEDRGSAVRLLAWSSVAQAGYLLVPLAASGSATGLGNRTSTSAAGATAAFALIYGVVNLGAFTAVWIAGRDPGRDALRLSDHRGLFARRPATALALAFFLVSLAGIPPGVAGLFGKVVLFDFAVDADATWLALVMAANVAIGLYYYAVWTVRLFTPTEPAALTHPARRTPFGPATALALTAAAALLLSVLPQLFIQAANL